MTPRRLLLALAAGTLCLALAGCVNIKSFTGSQDTPLRGVQIVSVFCTSGTDGCAGGGNSQTPTPSTNGTKVQLLVGYRVTAGSTPPATLRFFDDDGMGPLFSQSPSYTAELQRLAPAPAGQQWFGYLSSPFQLQPDFNQAAIFTRFGLPVAASGVPVTTYTYLVVAGGRLWDDPTPSATRPVVCGSSLVATNIAEGTICIDSPAPNDVTSWKTLPVRDLGIVAGAAPSAAPGQTAAVPFTLTTSAGFPPATQATLSAATTLAGATVTAAPESFTLASSATTSATVSVAVPAGAAPGSYAVALAATVGTEVRTAQGTITVIGPGGGGGGGGTAALPGLSGLSVSPKTIRNTRRAVPATLRITLSQPGSLRIVVARLAKGRRASGRCVASTAKLIAKGAPRCVRLVPVTTIVKANQLAGARSVTFSGRGRRPGTYRLGLTLVSGGVVSPPKTATVTVTG